MKRTILYAIFIVVLCIPSLASARDKLVVYSSLDPSILDYAPIRRSIEVFERKYGVEVKFVRKAVRSSDELHEAYLRLLSGGSDVPDILQIDVIRVPEFASMGYLVDLTGKMSPSERSAFFKNTMDEAMWDGRIWAYPFFTTFGFILYRKDLVGEPPETWEKLIKIAKKLQSKDIYGYVGQMAPYEGLTCNVLEFIWSNGGNPLFGTSGSVFSPRDVEALQIMIDMVVKHHITPPDGLKFKEEEGLQLLSGGKFVFLRHWPRAMLKLHELGKSTSEKYAFMPIPRGPSGKRGYASLGGWMLGINPHSKNPKAALELIRLLTGESFQKHVLLQVGRMSVRKSVYQDAEVRKAYPWIESMLPMLMTARRRPRSPFYPEISKIIQDEFHLALEGKISAAAAVERAQRKISMFMRSTGKAK